jgi:predicted TIM-barrel fold metal-dependent hydrolase
MATVLSERDRAKDRGQIAVQIVDCDVHPAPVNAAELLQFLPKRFHHWEKFNGIIPYRIDVINDGARVDAAPQHSFDVGRAGCDPKLVERQLLQDAGIDYGILIYHTHENVPSPEADAARCAAINEWMASLWLGEYNDHGRYRGSIRVPLHNPEAAIREIRKWADHPYFVEIMAVHSYTPAFGHPMYEPIWRVAAECGLPDGVHATNSPIHEGTPVGPPTYFFEWHGVQYTFAYAAHLASLACNGVFERIPDLKFVMVEAGISWSLPLGTHLDKNWKLLREEVPELTLAPSEYLKRQVFWTTQPIEEPRNQEALLQVYRLIDAGSRVMFSTDYPHWDYDDPKTALPRMPKELKQRIMFQTACELYGLPLERPADRLDR